MDPDILLREFLKATADPANRHLAARQFLTESASSAWDDAGSALLIDRVVFVETRGPERVSVTMQADILGSLSDMGVFETGEGALPDPGPDRTGEDARRLAHRQAAQRGLPGLAAVPGDLQAQHAVLRRPDRQDRRARPALRRGVRSRPAGHRTGDQAGRPVRGRRWRTPCATCSARRCGCAARSRGPTAARPASAAVTAGRAIDLENLSTTDPHSRQLLAAQIIWTLSRAGINGPYVINADGAALDDRFAEGWNTSDVAATDPGADPGAAAGLHALVGGSLVSLDGQRAPRVPGSFGQTARSDGGDAVAQRPGGRRRS